jgi:hypothetical protein
MHTTRSDIVAVAERVSQGRERILTEIRKVIVGQDEVIDQVLMAFFTVSLGALVVGTPTTVYTTPWGDNAFYGGISVRDTTATSGVADSSELIVADGNGVELDSVNLSGKESTEDTSDRPMLATSPRLVVTLVKGSVAGELRVW